MEQLILDPRCDYYSQLVWHIVDSSEVRLHGDYLSGLSLNLPTYVGLHAVSSETYLA